MSGCDIRRDVLLWTVHHCHRVDGREVSFEEEWISEGSEGVWRWRVQEDAWWYIYHHEQPGPVTRFGT